MSFLKRLFRRPEAEFIDVDPKFREANDRMVEEQSEENYRHLFEVLMRTTFWVATAPSNAGPDSGKATLMLAKHPDGNLFLEAYTEAPLLLRTGKANGEVLCLHGPAFFELAMKSPADMIHINPEGPVGGCVTRHQARYLAEGVIPEEIGIPDAEDVESMRIGPPVKPLSPEGLRLVVEAASRIPSIRAVYLAELLVNETSVPTLAASFADGVDEQRAEELKDRFWNEFANLLPATDFPLTLIPLIIPDVAEGFDASAERIYPSP